MLASLPGPPHRPGRRGHRRPGTWPPRPRTLRRPHPQRPGHRPAQPALPRLALVLIAQDLIAWTQRLALTGELARAEPKRLRYRLLHVAADWPSTAAAQGCDYRPVGPGPTTSPPPSSDSKRSSRPPADHPLRSRDDHDHLGAPRPRAACPHRRSLAARTTPKPLSNHPDPSFERSHHRLTPAEPFKLAPTGLLHDPG